MNRVSHVTDSPRDFDFRDEARAALDRGRAALARRAPTDLREATDGVAALGTRAALRLAARARPAGGWGDPDPEPEATARALAALFDAGTALHPGCAAAVSRGLKVLYDTQRRDGGWGAPASCPAVTGRALEALGRFGLCARQRAAARAVALLLARQDDDGAWRDARGGRPVAASAAALAGLAAVGFDVTLPVARRAVRWLKETQNVDGGWGAPGETAEALLGLIAAGDAAGEEARAAAEYLVGTQRGTGTWPAGTVALPLAALARHLDATARPAGTGRHDGPHPVPGPKFAA